MDISSIFENYGFLTNSIIAVILSSIACGITGTFVVVKKISYIGGGIAHAVMGGLGIAYFIGVNPIYGALVFSVFAAILIGYVKLKLKQNEDTMISALWAVGMATGIIFAYLTPGYNVNLLSFLFGNVLMISSESLWLLLILDLIIAGFVFVYYKQLIFITFDEEYAAVRGINVNLLTILLLIMVALTIVILVQTVGLILVIALLTLPSAIAGMFSDTLYKMIFLSIGLILLFSLGGLALAFGVNLPSGASIILMAGAGYLAALAGKSVARSF